MTTPKKSGYDAAIRSQDEDCPNRWPLAAEVYNVAINGPREWSVRIGIYGEWGSGKTSVLGLVSDLAEVEGHLVVWFDPWEYSKKEELWRQFVLTVHSALESKVGGVTQAGEQRLKAAIGRTLELTGKAISAVNSNAGAIAETGLDLVKKHFSFQKKDLADIQKILSNKRVIVLIDDLDRTAPELVPEILFALKELLDIPGFSFICAFDPIVVGKVLHQHHSGFGDGLHFLEKIIDYPRWLMPPTITALSKLAIRESKQHCGYVPEDALSGVIPLLPTNPRAVRQFIRLVSLLKNQIERHHAHELRWPIILTANVIKVRYPKIAVSLLNDGCFWDEVRSSQIIPDGEEKKQEALSKAIDDHICKTEKLIEPPLTKGDRETLSMLLKTLCSSFDIWYDGEKLVAYQMHIGEAPHAVTWKEFDSLFLIWETKGEAENIKNWIKQHANVVKRSEADVFRELIDATTRNTVRYINSAHSTLTAKDKPNELRKADSSLRLLNVLCFEMGKRRETDERINAEELAIIFQSFAPVLDTGDPLHIAFSPKIEKFCCELAKLWNRNFEPLLQELHVYLGVSLRPFEGVNAGKLNAKLCDIILPRYAQQVIDEFGQFNFIDKLDTRKDGTYPLRQFILDTDGHFWKTTGKRFFSLLKKSKSDRVIQENAFMLLRWLQAQHSSSASTSEAMSAKKILTNTILVQKIWAAATMNQLNHRASLQAVRVYRLINSFGSNIPLPKWLEALNKSVKGVHKFEGGASAA